MAGSIIDFKVLQRSAQLALDEGTNGAKAVITLSEDAKGGGISIGTAKWQTLGSRSDAFKRTNLDTRQMFLTALQNKYHVSEARRLPKVVLDALNLSDFCLDKKGNVTSQRPLTARRIVAIVKAMDAVEQGSDSLLAKVEAIKETKLETMTAEDDWQWGCLSGILNDFKDENSTKGKVLHFMRHGPGYRFDVGDDMSKWYMFGGDSSEGKVDSRFGSRLHLFEHLYRAGGWKSEDFVKEAIKALRLDEWNPVHEDLPLNVAWKLIRQVQEIRSGNADLIEDKKPRVVHNTYVVEITKKEYDGYVKKNQKFLDAHLKDLLDYLTKRFLPVATGERASTLRHAISKLQEDMQSENKSEVYGSILEKLKDPRYVRHFAWDGHSDAVRVEFMAMVLLGHEKAYVAHDDLTKYEGQQIPCSHGLSGWVAEERMWAGRTAGTNGDYTGSDFDYRVEIVGQGNEG